MPVEFKFRIISSGIFKGYDRLWIQNLVTGMKFWNQHDGRKRPGAISYYLILFGALIYNHVLAFLTIDCPITFANGHVEELGEKTEKRRGRKKLKT